MAEKQGIPATFYRQEAEEAVLGAVLIDSNAIYSLSAILTPRDFYRRQHAVIYEAMLAMADRGQQIDVITLMGELEARGALAEAGGPAALAKLAAGVPSSLHYEQYAQMVRDASIRRGLANAAQRIASLAVKEESGLMAAARAEQIVSALGEDRRDSNIAPVSDVMRQALDALEFVQNGGDIGLPYGFVDLDRLTGGMREGEFVLVAGRPGMGKSALGLQVAAHTAKAGRGVVFFSLEMPNSLLARRLLALENKRLTINKLRTARLDEHDWTAIVDTAAKIASWPLYIEDTAGMDIMAIRSIARRMAQRHDIALIVVDYVQLVQARQGQRWENRHQEVAAVARALKNLSKELGVTVLGLAQLSRNVDSRADKRPTLADLRESGELEQAADIVMALYREAAYRPEMTDDGSAELIIIKNRQGPLAAFNLYYDGEHTAFRDAVQNTVPLGGGR